MSFDVHKTDPYTCYVSAFDVLRVTEVSLICIKLQSPMRLDAVALFIRLGRLHKYPCASRQCKARVSTDTDILRGFN
jgi:hypothetical protein